MCTFFSLKAKIPNEFAIVLFQAHRNKFDPTVGLVVYGISACGSRARVRWVKLSLGALKHSFIHAAYLASPPFGHFSNWSESILHLIPFTLLNLTIMVQIGKLFAILTAFVGQVSAVSELYVCESPDENFLGTYTKGNPIDGATSYVNENDMAFFRHSGFWYLGDLQQWPPVTHYRCVDFEGCNSGEDHPAESSSAKWTINKRFGKEPIPTISFTPCDSNDEL